MEADMKECSKRQSFLGESSDEVLAGITIGIVGSSGRSRKPRRISLWDYPYL
jgi:hypothetical protein